MFALLLGFAGLWSSSSFGQMPPVQTDMPVFHSTDGVRFHADQARTIDMISRYQDRSHDIFVGEVLGVFKTEDSQHGHRVTFMVYEVFQGAPSTVIDVQLPAQRPYTPGDPDTAPITVIPGYQMLVFADRYGRAVSSNSLFLVEGGFAWRNKRPDVFLNPRTDREWVELIDPSTDYVVFSLANLTTLLEVPPHSTR